MGYGEVSLRMLWMKSIRRPKGMGLAMGVSRRETVRLTREAGR